MTPPVSASAELRIKYRPHRADRIATERRMGGRHPQSAFHHDRYQVRYRACFAGTGGGKTAAGAFEAVAWALENPGSVGILCEPDYPMVRRVLIPAMERLLGRLETSPVVLSYNKAEHRVEYQNGAVQWLLSLEEPAKAEGPNADYAWVDEARIVRHWGEAWLTLKRRLRGSRPGNRTGAWITTHSPTKDQVDEFEVVGRAPDYRVYRWSTRDNPLLGPQYISEIERSHTGHAYKLVVLGEYSRAEGLVYSEFDPRQHVRPAPAPYPSLQGPDYGRVSYGVDWGWTLPSCLLAIAWSGNRAHVVDEWYRSHATVEDLAIAARDMQNRWGSGKWHCDQSRPDYIDHLRRTGLAAEPYKGKVVDGVGILNGMFRGGELAVAPECANTLRELDLYSYPPDKRGPNEEPEKGNDHALDALRYSIMGARSMGARVVDVGW